MKINIFLFTGLLSLCACTQSELEVVDKTKGAADHGIVFKDSKDFMDTYDYVVNLNPDEQSEWAKSKNTFPLISSLDKCKDNSMTKAPKAFQALFNTNLEFQIQDSIMKYEQGKLYFMGTANRPEKVGLLYATTTNSRVEDNVITRSEYVSFNGGLGAGAQHEFGVSGSKYSFKYIYEFQSFGIRMGNQDIQDLYLILKMEYKYKSGWQPAGNNRDIDLNFSGSAVTMMDPSKPGGTNHSIGRTQSIKNVTEDQMILMTRYDTSREAIAVVWKVAISGTITFTMLSNPECKWISYR